MSPKHNLLLIQNLGDHLDDKFYMGTYIVLGLGLCITLAGVLGQWFQKWNHFFQKLITRSVQIKSSCADKSLSNTNMSTFSIL